MTPVSPPISVIVTVKNEVDSLDSLLTSLQRQRLLPREVIIVDGGSRDGTWEKLIQLATQTWPFQLRLDQTPGNRAQGRNRAIELTSLNWLAITDAGCQAEAGWLAALWQTREKDDALIVAGYYRGLPTTPFEAAVIPYALVMPDQVRAERFLPATRSLLIQRQVWQALGGFDEELADNEDYAFARRLAQSAWRERLTFAPKAVVGWRPRSSLTSFFTMLYRFARGDARAQLWRPKVALVFLRYAIGLGLLGVGLRHHPFALYLSLILVCLYLLWSISKNLRYAPQAWYWFPLLQLSADLAVLLGTLRGLSQIRRQ